MPGDDKLTSTAAAVLVMIGGAAWSTLPLALIFHRLRVHGIDSSHLVLAAIVAGAALGAVAASAALPRVPRATILGGAVLAAAVARGGFALLAHLPLAVTATDALTIGLAIAAATAGAAIGARVRAATGRLFAAAFLQLGLVVLLGLVAGELGNLSVLLLALVAGPILGGALCVRALPVDGGTVAVGYPVLVAITLGLCFVLSGEPFATLIATLAAAFVTPIPMALAAIGAALGGTRQASADVELPPAIVR